MNTPRLSLGLLLGALFLLASCDLFGEDDTLPGTIVFSAQDPSTNYNHQIFTMNADGSDVRRLTEFSYGGAYDPAWSPDGTQIAFSSDSLSFVGAPALWLMAADGSNLRPVFRDPEAPVALLGSRPAWSPDGTRLAFVHCISCEVSGTNYEIFVVDVASGAVTRLTEHPGVDTNPRWSPAGNQIAFISQRDYFDADTLRLRRDLYVMEEDGSGKRRLTNSGSPGGYIWMNTDTMILTATDTNTELKDVVVLNVATGNTNFILEDLAAKSLLWTFWDVPNQRLLTINMDYQELPVVIEAYDGNGELVYQQELRTPLLETALGFDWKVNKE